MATETTAQELTGKDVAEREPHEPPLGGYVTLAATFVSLAGGALLLTPSSRLRRSPSGGDVVLLGVATSVLARLVARDAVLTPLRAPFVEYEGPAGAGEVRERARGTGLRRAIGELLTCPFCMAPWASAALFAGLACAPRKTRWVASALAGVAMSNFLNQAYALLRKSA